MKIIESSVIRPMVCPRCGLGDCIRETKTHAKTFWIVCSNCGFGDEGIIKLIDGHWIGVGGKEMT